MSDSTSSSGPDNTQKALITVGVLVGCLVFAFVVAKIFDYCYDRHIAISDDVSDISEHTRDLIRSRLAVTAFRTKKKAPDSPAEITAKQQRIIRIWSAKAKESRKIAERRRAEEQAKQLAARQELIIKVEEASGESKTLSGPPTGTLPGFVIISEKSNVSSGAMAKKDEKTESCTSKTQAVFPAKPQIIKTLAGLDSSNKITETKATVAVTVTSSNTSTVSSSGATDPSATHGNDTPDTGRSDIQNATCAGTAHSPKPSGNKSQEPSSQLSKHVNSASPAAKTPPSRSPSPSKAPATQSSSPAAKTPPPRSPSPSKAPATQPATQSPGPKIAASAGSPPLGHKTPTSRSPSPDQKPTTSKSPEPKAPASKSSGPQSPMSKSPGPKSVQAWSPGKSQSPSRAASPTKTPEQRKKAILPTEKEHALTSRTLTQPELPNAPQESSKQEAGDSSNDSNKHVLTSSQSNQTFTAAHPADSSSKNATNATQEIHDLEAVTPTPQTATAQGKSTATSKPRPKSFSSKDSSKVVHTPKKLASSMALYGRASEDLDKHKSLVNKKRAAVSPIRTANPPASPVPQNAEQSPIVIAAAARKARIKSSKK